MEPLQRRTVLLTLAGVGLGAVAGCSDGGDGDSGTGDSGTDGSGDDGTAEESSPEATNSTEGNEPPTVAEPVEPTFGGKFTPDGAGEYTRFGWSLATTGGLAIVGADRDGGSEPPIAGAAYLYEWTGRAWRQLAEFAGTDVGDGFAHAVALTPDAALVGVPGDDGQNGPDAGSVAVYEPGDGAWQETTTLAAGDGGERHDFGASVGLSGQRALIGAPGETSLHGIGSGAAYVFGRDDGAWTQRSKLKPESGDRANNFGQSVALTPDTAVVGAPRASDRRGNAGGRVFVFERADGEWTQRRPLFADDSWDGARLGWDVAASGERFVAGAPGAGAPGGAEPGGAYVFHRTDGEWVQEAKLTGEDDPENPRGFGFSVDVVGNLVVVGEPLADAPEDEDDDSDEEDRDVAEAGRASVFQRLDGEWTDQGTITGEFVQADDHCGWSVAVTPEMALTGTPLHERPAGQDVGTVQYFEF